MPSFWAINPVRMASSELDLDIDAGREIELHQRVHGLRRRIDNVEHALVRADLELLARLLVDMRRAQHGEFLDLGRQRDRPAHPRAGALGRIDDLARRLIENAMIIGPEADADILTVHRTALHPLAEAGRSPAPTVIL